MCSSFRSAVGIRCSPGSSACRLHDVPEANTVDDVVARLRQFGACLARNVVEALNEEALLIAQGDAWQENEARVESGAAAQGPEVTVVLGDECPVLVHANLKYGVVG